MSEQLRWDTGTAIVCGIVWGLLLSSWWWGIFWAAMAFAGIRLSRIRPAAMKEDKKP